MEYQIGVVREKKGESGKQSFTPSHLIFSPPKIRPFLSLGSPKTRTKNGIKVHFFLGCTVEKMAPSYI
jgi:hypothetical protein